MKFFKSILISYYHCPYLNHPYDAPNILEPFRLLSHLYSIHHNLSPKNACPSNVSLDVDTPFAKYVSSYPSIVLLYRSHLTWVDTQYACVYDLCSQRPSKSLYLHYCKPVLTIRDNEFELRLLIP